MIQRAGLALGLILAAVSALASDLAEVKTRGTLRVLVTFDTRRPEFFSPKDGFDRELLEGFANLHRLKLEVVPQTGWDALIPALKAGKGDVIAGRFTATDSRRKLIDFTAEVFPYRLVVMTRKPHRVVRTVEELRGERVGTTKGTNMAEAVAIAGVPPSNVDDAIPTGGFHEALKSGRVTAAVWGIESAIATKREDPDIQIGMFMGPPASLAYGLRKEDADLLRALNEYIENVRRTPTWNRLVVKYFGESALEILKTARKP